jgi:hypothetical protein
LKLLVGDLLTTIKYQSTLINLLLNNYRSLEDKNTLLTLSVSNMNEAVNVLNEQVESHESRIDDVENAILETTNNNNIDIIIDNSIRNLFI